LNLALRIKPHIKPPLAPVPRATREEEQLPLNLIQLLCNMEREELPRLIATAVTDSVDALLTARLEPLQNQMAALSGTPPVLPMARDAELEAARQRCRDRLQQIDDERVKIRNST
jgi:hypothetical protein